MVRFMSLRPSFLLRALIAATFMLTGPLGAETAIGPKYFIANSLGPACLRDARGRGKSQRVVQQAMANLYRNHQVYVDALNQSTSLSVNKDAYAANWTPVLFNAYGAAASGDEKLARTILDGLSRMAAARLYLNEKGLLTLKQALKVQCYKNGPNSPCPSHTPRFVTRMYSNLMISAAVLQSFMTEQDRKVILPWFKAAYKKFVVPELKSDSDGIYDFANSGLTQLAYAALTGDKRLAKRELSKRKKDFTKVIQKSGYLRNNSYRGVRALWYHTYGLDPALSYALVAREWGQDFFRDPKLGPRLRAAVDKTALGVTNYAAFRSVGNRGESYSTDPRDRIASIHQFALNLPLIAKREFGINLPLDGRYRQLSRLESYSSTSGLMASCYYSGR
ncbi:MAG: alginate lyase family protein [Paracoccaceae bacterium]